MHSRQCVYCNSPSAWNEFWAWKFPGGHKTLMVSGIVSKMLGIPEGFETVKRKFANKLPRKISFNDGLYTWLVKNLMTSST